MSKRIMLPFITMCAIIAVMCIETLAGGLSTKDEISIPALSGSTGSIYTELIEDKELNEPEKVILNLLTSESDSQESEELTDSIGYGAYVKYLHNYLSSSGVTLSSSKAYEALNKIIELKAVINIEQESSFNKMSVDGRELAINLSQEIYDACGLKLSCDIQGNITCISDKAGNLIYLNPKTIQNAGIRLDALMITLAVIMVLLGICIIIARKNQLFKKEEAYDGFQEEGFVQ